MPTPIEHLRIAEILITAPALPASIRAFLDRDETVRGAFFFGHIAPDVQMVSRQPREVTHFFKLPPTNLRPAYERILAAYPRLAKPSALPADQAAFLAGYLSHLLLDELWAREIFYPIFGPDQGWGDRHERLLLHNVLRAWLDDRNLPFLCIGIGDLLRRVQPHQWLPFATDVDLDRWRDVVADQFEPGATIRTAEIFANRAQISDTEFVAMLEPHILEERIFSRVPLAELDRLYDQAVEGMRDLVIRYLNGCTGAGSG